MPMPQMMGQGNQMPQGMGQLSPYPGGDEIMATREAAQQQPNPVVDALKVMQMYVVAQREKGNEAPLAAFVQFLNTLQGGQEAAAAPQMQAQPAMASQPSPMASQSIRENQQAGTVLSQ